MSRASKTEAIVLKKRNLPSQDMIVTLFTKELGKVRIMAKGIKKISSKRSPHLQTGNLINVVIYNSDKKSYLQETSLISGLSQIKDDSKKLSLLYFYFHLLDRLLPENQQEPEIYKISKLFIINLSKSSATPAFLEKHLNVLLAKLGYTNKNLSLEESHRLVEELMNEKLPLLVI